MDLQLLISWRFDTQYEEMVAAGKANGVKYCIDAKKFVPLACLVVDLNS